MFRASKNRFETTSTVAAFFQVPRRIRNLSAPAAKARLAVLAISSLFVPIVFSESSAAQSAVLEANDSSISATAPMLQNQEIYIRPTHRVIAGNYAFDTFGPYPISGAVLAAGINQLDNSPPEWNQDAAGFGKRVGSNFGIAAIGTTTRYSLAEVFREDAMYYRCACTGVIHRTSHAVFSTVTARHGSDGHRAFSISALVAPYVGAAAGVYAWYPERYGVKDAFRIGNYSLLTEVGGNIALEFFASKPHSLLSRMHMKSMRGAPEPGWNK